MIMRVITLFYGFGLQTDLGLWCTRVICIVVAFKLVEQDIWQNKLIFENWFRLFGFRLTFWLHTTFDFTDVVFFIIIVEFTLRAAFLTLETVNLYFGRLLLRFVDHLVIDLILNVLEFLDSSLLDVWYFYRVLLTFPGDVLGYRCWRNVVISC